MDKIIIVGFGGHAKSVIDSIERAKQYEIIGYTDIEQSAEYRGYPYLGNDDVLQRYYDQGIKYAFITVGYIGHGILRNQLYLRLKQIGYVLPVVADISAQIAQDVSIGEGTFVGKGAIINAAVNIGRMCIINTGAIVEHDCRVGDFAHVSVGSVLCGTVSVGQAAFVGANATIIQGKAIGDNCIVAAGAVIRKDLSADHIFYNQDLVKPRV